MLVRSRPVFAAGISVAIAWCQVNAADPAGSALRETAWQKLLRGGRYEISDDYSGILSSLRNYDGNAKVEIIFDPQNKWRMDFRFVRDDHELLTLSGHEHSAFAAFDNQLYFANYPTDSEGCTVEAYDLASGKRLWQTSLHQSKPKAHSGYRNLVSLRVSSADEAKGEKNGAAIVITGKESYVDYVEVLDRLTGASLAIKEYRVGFGSTPPSVDGFDGNEIKGAPER